MALHLTTVPIALASALSFNILRKCLWFPLCISIGLQLGFVSLHRSVFSQWVPEVFMMVPMGGAPLAQAPCAQEGV